MRFMGSIAAIAAFVGCCGAWAGSDTEDLRKEIDALRRQLNAGPEDTIKAVDAIGTCPSCRGEKNENCAVTTKAGKLEIGGLIQIWEERFQHDHRDVFGNTGNSVLDNSGDRIRRTEIKFTMNITENLAAVIMIDPAREALSYNSVPSNQGLFKSQPAQFIGRLPADTNVPANAAFRVQTGYGESNRILQDAYINFHDLLPHHDITVGQFKPPAGEEGVRSSANLDFCERAMVNQNNELRDLGIQVHGTWWEDDESKIGRLQYWLGAFNGAGNFFNTAGDFQNRSDDNDQKDIAGKLMIRPIWSNCLYGRLELGVWGQYGKHGESGDATAAGNNPNIGLDRLPTNAHRMGAWALYKPMGCLRGTWLRGEYAEMRDRTAPNTVNALGLGNGPFGSQAAPTPFRREGWYVAAGYKLTDSIFKERLSKGGFFNNLLQPVEFAFRYESFDNIITQDNVAPDRHTDVYNTRVMTAGVNYYVWAYKHRIQVNYMNIDENVDNRAHPQLREVKNNAFIMSYQIAF